MKLKSITSFLFNFNFLQQSNKSKKYIRDTEIKIMFSTALWSKKHLQMGSIEWFLLSHNNFKRSLCFFISNIFMTLLNCAKSYMEKNSCGKRKLRKISQHTNAYTFILTTIFFNRWRIVSHIKSQASALKPSDQNKS